MKIKDLIEKSKAQNDRIELLEGTLKKVTDALEARAEAEASHLSWESRFEAYGYLQEDIKKRLQALERAHPFIEDSKQHGGPTYTGRGHKHPELGGE